MHVRVKARKHVQVVPADTRCYLEIQNKTKTFFLKYTWRVASVVRINKVFIFSKDLRVTRTYITC